MLHVIWIGSWNFEQVWIQCLGHMNASFTCTHKHLTHAHTNISRAHTNISRVHTHSIVLFEQVYISDVVPKTFYDEVQKMYFVSVTVCLDVVSQPSQSLMVHIDAKTDASHDEFNVMGVSVV